MAARSKARKRALDVLYEADQRTRSAGEDVESAALLTQVLSERLVQPGTQAPLPEYSVQIVQGVAGHAEGIDEALSTFSHGWTLERMPAVDRAILRLATWEILYSTDVPHAVAIDEAVTLASTYSTDDSPTFVNGLLARIATMAESLRE